MLEIGSSLVEERRRQGVTLADVEAATLIRARYIDALEHEQFDLLPVGSYRRSFLRAYAVFLGLNGDVYAEEYDLRLARLEAESPTPAVRRGARLFGLLAEPALARGLVVIAAVALVGFAVWKIGGSSGPGTVNAAPPAARPHAPHAPRPHPSQPVVRRHAAPARRRGRPGVRPSRPSPPRRRPSLTLTAARGNCWLLVRIGSSAGRTIYERTLDQGQSVRFGLGKLLWIQAGAPRSINASIDGHATGGSALSVSGALVATSTGLRAAP